MTELYIDGQPVVLPPKFQSQISEENPFYTKRGKYTLDIEISLKNKTNAQIYGNLGRFNFSGILQKERSAVLVVNGKVELNGTELLLEVKKYSVKIQLVSGNSELNYFASNGTKIRDLNLGSFSVSSTSTADPDKIYFNQSFEDDCQAELYQNLIDGFPTKNFVLAPTYANDQEKVLNAWDVSRDNFSIGTTKPRLAEPTAVRPQPYFAAMINKVIQALGFSIEFNCIGDHSLFKYYYLVHGFKSWEWAKMLPDWTVSDFLSKIEKQFNSTFVVNEKVKSVKLLFNGSIQSGTPNYIEVIDDYSYDISPDNILDISISNIEYNLDDNAIYKYNKLPKNIFDYALKDTYTTLENMMYKVSIDANRLKRIYEGIYGSFMVIDGGGGAYLIKHINQYLNVYQNDSDSVDETFDIIPAPMMPRVDNVYYRDLNTLEEFSYPFYNQIPVVFNSERTNAVAEDSYILDDLITEKQNIPEAEKDTLMRLARFSGPKSYQYTDEVPFFTPANFPVSFVDSLAVYFDGRMSPRFYDAIDSMSLSWMAANIYSAGLIDTTKMYRLTFIRKDNLDVLKPFIANHKKFICQKFEKKITDNGYDEIYEGDFYPMND